MKVKVSFHENTAHIHIHKSKSKSRLKNIVNSSKSAHKMDLHGQSLLYQTDPLTQNIVPITSQSGAKTKRSCEHKKKTHVEGKGEYEYFKISHRSREQLQRQNEKLRKENKVLNEYCTYFEKKLSKTLQKTSDRAFSFRNTDGSRGKLLFGELSKETAATSSKSNSKVHRYLQ